MPSISAERWKRIESLLDQALELPVSQRTTFLKNAANKDEVLHTLLMGVWEAGKKAEAFLEGDVPIDVVAAIDQLSTEAAYGPVAVKGMQFGEYRIVEEIGRGGMSVVYEAERADGQFEQITALKILKRGMDTDLVIQRFLAERQILAQLQHANIARLLDGGATPDGRPYLVMEYVDGVPITTYCDREKLGTRERLALFLQVGRAVAFAHRNLVVHRDLKPSNILVTADGEVKLLDFGIAKVLSRNEQGTALTVEEGRVMTPEYAAPEQIYGDVVTTATDVYAMGVLLYDLLCSRLPIEFPVRKLNAIERTMREREPLPPSARVVDQPAPAKARGTTPGQLVKTMAGDLDQIVLKALRKAPERRYSSVSAFTDDVSNYLAGLPVRARPDTVGYRIRKFYGRHRTSVIASIAAFVLLFFGLISTLWQAEIASAERDIAQREAAKSARVTELLVQVFESTDPEKSLGDTLTAYDILARGAVQIELELEHEPELRSKMIDVIGRMYQQMGEYEKAKSWLSRSLALRENIYADDTHVEVLESTYHLSAALRDLGEFEEAERVLREAVSKPLNDDMPGQVERGLQLSALLGSVLADQQQFDEAESFLRSALARQVQRHGAHHPDVAPYYARLGELLTQTSVFQEADSCYEQAISIYRAHPEGNRTRLANLLHAYADGLRDRGAFELAAPVYRQSLTMKIQLLGPDHPVTVQLRSDIGMALSETGQNDAAEEMLAEALDIQQRILGEKHPETINMISRIAENYTRGGESKKAVEFARRALNARIDVFGHDYPLLAMDYANLGVPLLALGQYEQAEGYYRASMQMAKKFFGPDHFGTAVSLNNLASALLEQGRFKEAMPLLDQALNIYAKKLAPDHHLAIISLINKGKIYTAYGEFEEAETYLSKALELFLQNFPADHYYVGIAKMALGKLYLEQGDCTQAEPLFAEIYEIQRNTFPKDDWRLGETQTLIGACMLEQGQETEGMGMLERGYRLVVEQVGRDHKVARRALAFMQQN